MATAQERSQLAAFNRRLRKRLGALGELHTPATGRVTRALGDAFTRHAAAEANRERAKFALCAAREGLRGPRKALVVLVESASCLSGLTPTHVPRDTRGGPMTLHLARATRVVSDLEAMPDSFGIHRRLQEGLDAARASYDAVCAAEKDLSVAREEVYFAVLHIQDTLQLAESVLKRTLPPDSPALKRVFGKPRRVKPGVDEDLATAEGEPVQAMDAAPPEVRVGSAGGEEPSRPGPSSETAAESRRVAAAARQDAPNATNRRRLARAQACRPLLLRPPSSS